MKKQNKKINTKRTKKMKTTILSLALVFTFFAQFSFSNNLAIEFEDEKYVNDIPFNTEVIALSAPCFSVYYPKLILEDENYINDIPFNTEAIALSVLSFSIYHPELILEDEKYINDIPFDTYKVSANNLEYYKILLSNMNNKIQSIFKNCCSKQIENQSQDIFNNVINVIEKISIKIIN